MKIRDRTYLVGSGAAGFGLTDRLDSHVYLVDGDQSWVLVDAGAGRAPELIIDRVRATSVNTDRPGHLLLTHGHADHSGGAAALLEAFPALVARAAQPAAGWIAAGDVLGISLDRGKASGVYPDEYTFTAAPSVTPVRDGDRIELGGGASIRIVETPGHCEGHCCYLLEGSDKHRSLFSGDCVFTRGRISLQNLHDTQLDAYAASVNTLNGLGVDDLFPGHYSVMCTTGGEHIRLAADRFNSGLVPPSVI